MGITDKLYSVDWTGNSEIKRPDANHAWGSILFGISTVSLGSRKLKSILCFCLSNLLWFSSWWTLPFVQCPGPGLAEFSAPCQSGQVHQEALCQAPCLPPSQLWSCSLASCPGLSICSLEKHSGTQISNVGIWPLHLPNKEGTAGPSRGG